jgi:hypothetical protein
MLQEKEFRGIATVAEKSKCSSALIRRNDLPADYFVCTLRATKLALSFGRAMH